MVLSWHRARSQPVLCYQTFEWWQGKQLTRHPKNGQHQDTLISIDASPLCTKQHRAAQMAVSDSPQPAGPPKNEGVFLRRCATVMSTSPCQGGQFCSPCSHPFAGWVQHVKMGVWAALYNRVFVMNSNTMIGAFSHSPKIRTIARSALCLSW